MSKKILTQKIEVVDPQNPLDSKTIVVPVHKHEKILCTEPYVLDVLKYYTNSFDDDTLNSIKEVESCAQKSIVTATVDRDYVEGDKSAQIFISPKHTFSIDLDSKTASHIKSTQQFEAGGKIDLVVTRSKTGLWADATSAQFEKEKLRNELIRQIGKPQSAYLAHVKDCVFNAEHVFNGYTVSINGLECFMPGSEASVAPLDDYTSIVDTDLYVVPVNLIKESIVVSHKFFMSKKQTVVLDALLSLPREQKVSGVISSIKDFGVFGIIDECVPTLLFEAEMDEETKQKFHEGLLRIGDSFEFFIESISDGRVNITQTSSKTEGWNTLETNVLKQKLTGNEFASVEVNVNKLISNGFIAEVKDIPGVTFFVNSTFAKLDAEPSVNDSVVLKIKSVDVNKRNVRLY